MLRTLPDMPAGVIGVEVQGEIDADDYKDVLLPALDAQVAATGELRIVLVFPEYDGYTAGAAWEDLKMGAENLRRWKRIALVTDVEWMARGLKAFAWMVPGDVKHFPMAERDAATAWAAG